MNDDVPVLLVMQNLKELQSVFFGYDCIATSCASVFEDEARVWKQEWFTAHFGKGIDFLPFLLWLYKQQKVDPKIVLRGNKVIQ